MKNLSGGIDLGSEAHHIVVMDEGGKILYDKKTGHKFTEFHKAIAEFKEIEEKEKGKISFAVEGKNGYGAPFDRILIDAGFTLYNVDNLKLKRFRSAFGAEYKTDKRDAKMLAKLISLRKHLDTEDDVVFTPIAKVSVVNEKLKVLSRHQQTLIDEKVRMQNRLRKKLLEICPQVLDIGDMDSKKLLKLLVKYPDFSKYKKIKEEDLLKIDGIGKASCSSYLNFLHQIEYVKELVDAYAIIIKSYAERILKLKEEIEDLDRKLDEIGKESTEVSRLRTIPGVAVRLSSRLIGEIGDIKKFKNENQLAIYCGVGCVNDNSGKKERTKAVYKANKICKKTLIEIAGCSIRYVEESRRYYAKKRAEGKEHNHALRCLARQLIKVIFKMLTEDRDYIIKEIKEDKKEAA